jgi:hypothetical protein
MNLGHGEKQNKGLIMDTSFIGYIIAAFFGAGFGVGGNLITRFVTEGKVTPDHLKKEDLDDLKHQFEKHIEKHTQCEREFLPRKDFDKHVDLCVIRSLKKEMTEHEIQHGKLDSEIFTRLKTIEKQINDAAVLSSKFSDLFAKMDLKVGLVVQKLDLIIEDKRQWEGIERRKT